MLKAYFSKYTLDFTFEAITSRDRMWHKDTYIVVMWDDGKPGSERVAEVPLFRGLSADDVPDFEGVLTHVCQNPESWRECTYPAIRFGFESLFSEAVDNEWTRGERGIPINGLVWMGDKDLMAKRIAEKIDQGFSVIKLKIGGIAFEDELDLIRHIRSNFSPDDLEIRLDANGSFSPSQWLERLGRLEPYAIHSIEQPLHPRYADELARGIGRAPVAVALDEQLIGWRDRSEAADLLDYIRPHYIILKPALIGGTEAADMYIGLAGERGIGWWATSALESNIGLYAIAAWLSKKDISMPQGLGTGQLYSNNIGPEMVIRQGRLFRK